MAKCWLCGRTLVVGEPYCQSFLFGPACVSCDDGFVMGWNAQRDAIAKREKVYRSSETPADSNSTLGLKDEEL